MMKKIAIICFAVTMAVAANAQNTNLELSLDKAIEIALSDNPTIKIADMEIVRQDYVRKETVGNLLPSLSAGGTYSRNIMKQKLGGSIDIQGNNSLAGQVSLGVPLFAPGIYRTLKVNDNQLLAALETARGSKISLISEVRKSYYSILMSQQSLNVLLSSEKTISETVENTRLMLKNGLSSEYDLITAEVQLSNLKPTIIQTESSIVVAEMVLRMLLSLPESVSISLTGDLDYYKDQILTNGIDFDRDITNNSDLRSLDLQEKIMESQYRAMKSARMPVLSAFGNFSISGEEDVFGGMMGGESTVSSSNGMIWQKPFAIGVSLSIPIFSGFTNVNKEKQLKNSIGQLQLQRDYLYESKVVEVNTSVNNIFTAREQMFANEKTVGQAQKAYEISNVRFKAGSGIILEVNSAELALTQAKLNYTQSIFNYLSAQAEYERTIGEIKYK